MIAITKPVHDSKIVETFEFFEVLFSGMEIMIAGGSVRKALFNQEIGESDVDIFFKNQEDLDRARALVKSESQIVSSVHLNCTNAIFTSFFQPVDPEFELIKFENLRFQLITKNVYPTMEDLLGSFDFTVCQFGYEKKQYFCGDQSYDDHVNNRLVKATGCKQTISPGRYLKYLFNGYEPAIELFDEILINGRSDLTPFDLDLDLDLTYSDLK